MAEFGDPLSTAITAQSEGTPSIFETLAQDNLNNSIRPALKHIVKILVQKFPHKFSWTYHWYDELYTMFECVIQHHFLSNKLASFAEYYYDMQRKPVDFSKVTGHCLQGSRYHLLSIMALTVFPYLHLKLANLYAAAQEQSKVKGPQSLSLNQVAISQCYPFIHMLCNACVLYYNFMYAIGYSEFHSPLYKALNVKLISVNPLQATPDVASHPLSKMFTKLLTSGVQIGIFAIQFLDWWYDDENENSAKSAMKQMIPEPPVESLEKTDVVVPRNGICPLCHRHRTNDTALQTSGYVFCYVCIYKFVKANSRCPITGYKTEPSHLIKIYPPS